MCKLEGQATTSFPGLFPWLWGGAGKSPWNEFDLASLSLIYWLTKFAQEVTNKNEIVNSAWGTFTEFRNAFKLRCKRKCKRQTIEVIKLCLSCVLLFLIDLQTHVFGYDIQQADLHRGTKVHPCDLNADTQLVHHLMNY